MKYKRPAGRTEYGNNMKVWQRPDRRVPPPFNPPKLSKADRAERRRYRQANRPDHQLPMPTVALGCDKPEKRRLRKEVLAAAGNKCQNCGRRSFLTIDHIVPRHLGGGNHRENLQCLCEPCNKAKGLGIWAPPRAPPS